MSFRILLYILLGMLLNSVLMVYYYHPLYYTSLIHQLPADAGHFCANETLSNMLCPASRRPRVAYCFAGIARTLSHRVVARSIRQHLIEAFGGDPVVFAYLRLNDERGDARPQYSGLVNSSAAHVWRALRSFGARAANVVLRQENTLVEPSCPLYTKRPETTNSHMQSANYARSLLGQLANRAHCVQLVLKHEKNTNTKFDVVFLSRPDMAYLYSTRPWCTQELKQPLRFHDWAFRVPRGLLEAAFLHPYQDYMSCKEPLSTYDNVENWMFRVQSKHGVHWREAQTDEMRPVVVRVPGSGYPRLCPRNTYCGRVVDSPCNINIK